MTQADPSETQNQWQRQTAVSCNNRAWELAVKQRSTPEDREMLDAAHAAAWHWARIGTELHQMRATMLLAEVHALLGHGQTALQLATPMREYFLARRDTPDWEQAFTHSIFAHCALRAGESETYRAAYALAAAALATIADDEDRKIVALTFNQIPSPHGEPG